MYDKTIPGPEKHMDEEMRSEVGKKNFSTF